MFIGIILAGDGEVEQAIGPYDTHDEATQAADKILNAYYDKSFDRVITVGVSSFAEVVKECEEQEQEEAEYRSEYRNGGQM